ncbi:hypothetical protein LINPERHAP1_LOCUS31468 [Linum perenne]
MDLFLRIESQGKLNEPSTYTESTTHLGRCINGEIELKRIEVLKKWVCSL